MCIIYYCCYLDFYIGIYAPKQVNDVVVKCLGCDEGCGMIINKIYVRIYKHIDIYKL
jgi:hypothetical protein